MSTKGPLSEFQCSFCSKGQSQVRQLVAGPGRVYICDECIRLCQNIVDEDTTPKRSSSPPRNRLHTPREIREELDRFVVGQDQAKKTLSVAVYNHYKRVWLYPTSDDVELQKTNILLVGPTGSGKTLLAQTLAKILDVPFAIADATALTEAGYVGEDVENILLRLIQAADWDIARAEQGIIYIDELDKIARKEGINPSITRDVSGEGVQQGLLKIIEGCVANVPPQGGRKHPHQDFIQIKTDNILFLCGGTFDNLEKIVARRESKTSFRLGFKAVQSVDETPETRIMDYLIPEDLLSYGFIPELVGRFPMVVNLDFLNKADLVKVLTQPANALIKQYQRLFSMDHVELHFSADAVEAIADKALRGKTGARGLRAIIEATLLDVMYELPSNKDVTRCLVDGDVINGKIPPLLMTTGGGHIDSWSEQKPA